MQRQFISLIAATFSVGGLASHAWADVRTLLDSGRPGPTVLLVTDPAGTEITTGIAVEQVGSWTLTKGKVLTATSKELQDAVRSAKPDALVVMNVVRGANRTATLEVAGDINGGGLCDELNGLIDDKGEKITLVATPTTLPSVAVPDRAQLTLSIKNGGTVPAARTRLFRHAVHSLLVARGMTDSSEWKLIDAPKDKIKVAMYAGIGSNSTPGVLAYPKAMGTDPTIRFTYVGPAELKQPGMLDQFDVVIFCGGMSNSQSRAIGPEGETAVRDFVKHGGGYVSSCAGSYLATSGFDWSLKILAADVQDYKHWLRGTGPVDIELTDEGREILGDYHGLISLKYANGPLLGVAKEAGGLPAFTTLAFFRSDMAKSAPGGQMPNTPAIVSGSFGDGRILCFSPHPEYTDGLESFVTRAVRWTAKRPLPPSTGPIPAPTTQPTAAAGN